uniref:CCHC-type domain-containing protein n=1 Tax=Phytophthora ramorum TaxID=164328 RepID=H3H7U2_PHYRM
MPGMVDYEYDAEGDVRMTVPQPIFEVVAAPELAVWSQAAITTFIRERRQYEAKIAERCSTTGEVQETVARSIRTSLKPRVLEHVTHYILKKEVESVTDAMLLAEMKRKVGGMVNDRVPDVSRLFAELKMDLEEVDVEARIAKYFMGFDRLVEDNGLTGMLGRGPAVGEAGRQRLKMRCKLLLTHVTPEILKVDLTRLVELTHREAKVDDLALHDLMIERATRQQQYYLMQNEMKQSSSLRPKEDGGAAAKAHGRPAKQLPKPSSIQGGGRGAAGPRKPPRDGCLVCKGPHWARDCPTATAEQKANVEKML